MTLLHIDRVAEEEFVLTMAHSMYYCIIIIITIIVLKRNLPSVSVLTRDI